MGHGKKTTKKSIHIPRNWRKKCRRDVHWCAQLLDSLTDAEKIEKLNCGKPFGPVDPLTIEASKSDCKKEFPQDATKQKECLKMEIMLWKLSGCHIIPARTTKHGKRAANLTPDKSDSGLAVFLCLGALLSLIVVGVLLYCFLFRAQTSGRQATGSKGASKAKGAKGASQTGKSKLGKSKLGSRKSSQRTSRKGSKRSKGTKSRLSAKK